MSNSAEATDDRLKVLHIGKYFPPYRGGMESYLRDLMTALKPLGVDSSALVITAKRICGKVMTMKARNLEAPRLRATISWFMS